jgi:Pregnancy-associated plasma protein-A/Secretion system C-terminal sorting domain
MRRVLLCLLLAIIFADAYTQKDCRQQLYQQQLLATHPQLSKEYEKIEAFTRSLPFKLHTGTPGNITSNAIPPVITIPVVVHVLWNTNAQNITDAQILSQIGVLNNDYRGTNADLAKIPSYFTGIAADCGFQFVLAKVDPKGRATNGIVRRRTDIGIFGLDDRVKNSAIGGDDAWNADNYLNIWVCNTVGGILGYSSAPGGPKEIDGVVINTAVFGTINISGEFNKGRTAVHEIGHWLNLRHIWGDTYCGDDKVDDTPTQERASRGCPGGEIFSCGSTAHGDMYMNYMDFTDDACMFMFTKGQRERMRAMFETGGPRNALLYSQALNDAELPKTAPVPEIIQPDFAVLLYPNPTSATITVQSQETVDCIGKSMLIYNHLGQIVSRVVLMSRQQQVDVSRLQNGLYFIKIDGLTTKAMTKFVKQ